MNRRRERQKAGGGRICAASPLPSLFIVEDAA
jgi:hypothetical protein